MNKQLEEKLTTGINLQGERILMLSIADDIVLLSDKEDLDVMLQKKFGLKTTRGKSYAMYSNKQYPLNIKMVFDMVKETKEFWYFVITNDRQSKEYIKSRIQLLLEGEEPTSVQE